jgi:hypothetical protein
MSVAGSAVHVAIAGVSSGTIILITLSSFIGNVAAGNMSSVVMGKSGDYLVGGCSFVNKLVYVYLCCG